MNDPNNTPNDGLQLPAAFPNSSNPSFSADPFVATANLAPTPAVSSHENVKIEENLKQVELLEQELDQLVHPSPPSSVGQCKPTVEVIGIENPTTATADVAPPEAIQPIMADQVEPRREIKLNISAKNATTSDLANQSATEDDEQDAGLAPHEYELALNVLPQRQQEASPASDKVTKKLVPTRPPLNLDPVSDELVFDVRDFSRDSQQPLFIANSFEVAPDTFDFFTPEQITTEQPRIKTDSSDSVSGYLLGTDDETDHTTAELPPESTKSLDLENLEAASTPAQNPEADVFLAENDQVIRIDGNDGFNAIDLTCFELSQATLEPGVIRINAPELESHFVVLHRNVPVAIFKDDLSVSLA